jgi:amidase
MSDAREPIARRTFLNHVAVIGAAAAGGIAATEATSVAAPSRSWAWTSAPFDLEEITVAELQSGMASGRYTARGIVEQYLARIAAMDRSGPSLRSIIETNPEALDLADQLDRERAAKGPRGPLHGVPVLLKDNIDTSDRLARA